VIGLSADGPLALTYMRLYPHSIRSAIIDSGQSTQHLWLLDAARGETRALGRIFAGCAANAACNGRYPHLGRVYRRVVRRLQRHPITVAFPDIPSHPVLRLDGVGFAEDTMNEIFPGDRFDPESIHQLMSDVWRSGHGGLRRVYRERLGGPLGPFDAHNFLAEGKTMSYVCHDLVAFITRADIRQAAREMPALAPVLLDPRLDLAQGDPVSPAGCRLWHVGRAPQVQHQPVRSSIPTLVLSGEYDTDVPPVIVDQIPPTLRHVYAYRMPASPHIQLANYNVDARCARSIARQFLDVPGRRPDSSCIASLPRFDFTPPTPG
jgi:pimeloyl-ACP methyl ester carboxylesterase